MSAFLSTVGKMILKYVLRWIWDHVQAWQERKAATAEQKKKDEKENIEYQEVIQNGSKEDIIKKTEDIYKG